MIWHPFNEIEGCGMLEYKRFEDDRGFFSERFNRKEIAKNEIPLPWSFKQQNISFSYAGVLRGFHLQHNNPQGKLVTCITGRIMDVCLDMRPQSKSYMKMTRVMLDGLKPQSFWLPPGCAHAFLAFEDSLVQYECSTEYDKASDAGINACSPELQMLWPPGEFTRSERDRSLPLLSQYLELLPIRPSSS